MNIKELKKKILDEIRYGELNNDMGFVPEWLGKTDMPRHAESVKCFRDGVTCKRYTDAVIVKNAFEEFEKTDVPDTNVGKWIPCSERLPEHTDEYNVTIGVSDMAGYCEYVTTLKYVIMNGKHIGWKIPKHFDEIIRIIAWMPLPEPYKESED